MVRLISILLFLYGCAFGLDNQYQLALNGVTVATASTFMRNVGQAQHGIFVSATSCSTVPGQIVAAVQGSYDNSTYFNIGPSVVVMKQASANSATGLGTASGAYPYIRVNYAVTSSSACTVSIWYTGAVNPSGVINGSYYYVITSLAPTGAVSATPFGPAVSLAGSKFVVYGLVAMNITGGSNGVTIQDYSNGAACTGSTTTSFQFQIASGEKFALPTSQATPYLATATGSGLCLATTGTGTTQVTLIGRYE